MCCKIFLGYVGTNILASAPPLATDERIRLKIMSASLRMLPTSRPLYKTAFLSASLNFLDLLVLLATAKDVRLRVFCFLADRPLAGCRLAGCRLVARRRRAGRLAPPRLFLREPIRRLTHLLLNDLLFLRFLGFRFLYGLPLGLELIIYII